MNMRFVALALAAITACGGEANTSPKQTVDGQWIGTIGSQDITLNLVQSGSAVSGSGTITNTPTGTRALSIAGAYTPPSIAVTLSSGSVDPMSLQASVAGASMTGSLTGSGFTGEGITLTRQ
jgi:hypothetical protein